MTLVLANQIQIEYEQFGKPENETLVLIRGLGTQLIDWPQELIEGLVDLNLHIVIFDNRDVGLTEKFSDFGIPDLSAVFKGKAELAYSANDMADDVIGLMDVLKIEKAHILGISMGGMIAQLIAATYPERLLSMLSVMSSSSRSGLPGATAAAQTAMQAVPDVNGGAQAVIEMAANSMLVFGSPGYPENLEHRMQQAKRQYERCYNPDGVARQMAALISSGDRTEKLKTIRVPTTVIHGVDDALIPIACGIDTANSIPGSTMVEVPGMGHNIPIALVPQFVDLLDAHLIRANVVVGK